MTRADEFTHFYNASAAHTFTVTYAACGDRDMARAATVDAYQRLWRNWAKMDGHELLPYVRTEAWKSASVRRGTRPLRKRDRDDAQHPLLTALGELPSDARRLIVLLTLGGIDLPSASRGLDLTSTEGMEAANTSLAELERRLETDLSDVEERLHALSAVQADLPDPAYVRSAARRGQRINTLSLVVGAVVLLLLGGFLVTDHSAVTNRADVPDREKIGAEGTDLVLSASKLNEDDLLTTKQVSRLNPDDSWKISATDTDLERSEPYATCPQRRFADPDPQKAFVRTFESDGKDDEHVAQSIEVSRSIEAAEEAHRRLVRWYADCQLPRVQLTDSYTVERPFGNFTVLRLRSHRSPVRTFTVGLAHSGTINSVVVHEQDGAEAPDVEDFAATLNTSIMKVCDRSGGNCSREINVKATDPPAIGKQPQFLATVDLPPIEDIDHVWAGAPVNSQENPAATPCEHTEFSGPAASVDSQIFVIPNAKKLPKKFGISETVGTFPSDKEAKKFVKKLSKRVKSCEKDNLAADVSKKKTKTRNRGDISTAQWRMTFEVSKDESSHYRMALVRRDNHVAQVTFTSTPHYDLNDETFGALAVRAGQRLSHIK